MKPKIQFSLFALFALTLLVALTLTFATKQRVPKQNQLMVQVDNKWQVYDVDSAEYGIYQEGNTFFLTVTCSTSRNPRLDPPDCKLEFSIPYEKDPTTKIKSNARFDVPVYDDQHGNLNFFYYLGWGEISDGIFEIRAMDGTTIDGTLKANGGTLMLRAIFTDNGVTRSFD